MRIARGLVVVGLLSFAAAGRADEAVSSPEDWKAVRVVKLRSAVAAHCVEASGSQPQSYTAVTLHLKNLTAERVAVDIAGSYLRPREGGSCQRLGLGPAVTPSGVRHDAGGAEVVLLEPATERDLVVNTCCLDLGLPAPRAQSFTASTEELPAVREKVLRWWVDHPDAEQGVVNCAIWNDEPQVREGDSAAPRAKRRAATVHGDDYYELVDGELTRIDVEGVRRLLGTNVRQVIPTDDGTYAVIPGAAGTPQLRRLEMTGERRWSLVMDLDEKNQVRDVINAGKGRIVVVCDKSVDLHDVATGATKRVLENDESGRVSARRVADDRLLLTTRRPASPTTYVGGQRVDGTQPVFELWSLALDTGKAARVREFWNVATMTAGPAGVFALSPTESGLRKLSGARFGDFGVPSAFARVFVVAADVVWASGLDGKLVAVDAATGGVRFRSDVSLAEVDPTSVDPKSGDLAYVRGDEFRRVHAADGRVETVK